MQLLFVQTLSGGSSQAETGRSTRWRSWFMKREMQYLNVIDIRERPATSLKTAVSGTPKYKSQVQSGSTSATAEDGGAT